MAQLTVRNIDSDLVQRLKIRAARHNRSAEAEHRVILESALRSVPADFSARASELRAAVKGRRHTDSVALLRQDRDRNHRP